MPQKNTSKSNDTLLGICIIKSAHKLALKYI